MSNTNNSLAVFLVDDRARCIKVAYDKTQMYGGKDAGADIKSFKTLDPSIKKGDFVVVPTNTRWGFTVGRVEEVDVIVNYANPEEMRWAVKFEHAKFEQLVKEESVLIGAVAKAEEQDAREQLKAKMMKMNPNLGGLMLLGNRVDQPAPDRDGGFEPAKRGGAQKTAGFYKDEPAPPSPSWPDDDIPL